jgi:arsenite methyltransferase
MSTRHDDLREQIRPRYAAAIGAQAHCCGPGTDHCDTGDFGAAYMPRMIAPTFPTPRYSRAWRRQPHRGRGVAAGEIVLDLGSGGGLDILLSARRVEPTGKAYGVDMTAQMLELARRNAAEAGRPTSSFSKAEYEAGLAPRVCGHLCHVHPPGRRGHAHRDHPCPQAAW